MGRGDKRTKRGKIFIGTFGVSRPVKNAKKDEPTEEAKKAESKAKKSPKA
jgi:30S ribosomal protein S31